MIANAMLKSWRDIKKYRYLLIASAAIVIAIFALLLMQYRSVKRTQEQVQKTIQANLERHLFEVTEETRRGIIDHANHIIHSIRQQYVRDRKIPTLENTMTGLRYRYPEIENIYVVFFEAGFEQETWNALKLVMPESNQPNARLYKGKPVGRLLKNEEDSESIRRAWQSIEKENMTKLYTVFDPQTEPQQPPTQYFIHTVFEGGTLKPDNERQRVGLVVFSANPTKFPSADYYQKLAAKHQNRDKEIDGLIGKMDYKISLDQRDLVNTNPDVSAAMSRRFEDSDKLFPNLTFAISSPDIEAKTYANESIQSGIFLGLVAAVVAIIGLILTWRATRREMQVAQVKSDFLDNISHELKTPLTAIRAFGDLLHSGRANKPDRIQEYGGIIKKESDRLTVLINNILEMSRMERGIRKYRLETGDLRETVADTVEIFRLAPDVAKFEINVKLPIEAIQTKFDEGAIRQAVINLLSNAVKYSGSNEILRIDIELKNTTNEAIIEVKDFGFGISKDEQRNIFLPFHRVENDEIQAKGGTGLGLAIVREIARSHGGDVSVESEVGAGSAFSLHLPILAEIKQTDWSASGSLANRESV
jgi:signal transduction histidine kinase